MTSPSAPRPSKPATILDVAAAAGVSRQTVTRAMNSMPGIKPATRERILGLAKDLGYTPSRFAKGLVQGARTSVGLAIPDLTNPYFPAFASSVVELATQRGWYVVMDDYGHGRGSGLEAVRNLSPHVDAVIGYLGGDAGPAQALLGRRPLIVLDQPAGTAAGCISFDYAHAAKLALDHLASAGRRQIAYLDVRQAGEVPTVRGAAFAGLFGSAGTELTCFSADESAEAARRAVRNLLARNPQTDGIVVFNDLMAAGALKALTDMGRSAPADCAVIGMDGIPLGELLTPELTTLALDLRDVGRAAVDLLEQLMGGLVPDGVPAPELVLRHRLVLRQSA
ncbi:LacI family DNA-binding transcriptional regulator [Arthrobacter sp. PAMC25284]|uniref:LacI family DNA-binding transcriptional regulator n=1 Tax=Arthrobacter sp. PAMC25284 TaxID=2861279 RepID=UPI001C629122|nr:LacI family DNA-binding transcriptional regulator [Arthrobacter sp. PAMC25284]QYF89017.1 LacI family transcriptional regulator [Arthrobacter sp. PAMC25284]